LLFRRWLVVVNKPIINLSEDVEHKRARTFISSIVFGTAIDTITISGEAECAIAESQGSLHDVLELHADQTELRSYLFVYS
jgi:hypothetical protein